MPSVAIIGASRGIGLELVRQYANAGWRVHATTRTPDAPGSLGDVEGDVVLHALEVRNADQIAALAAHFEQQPLDVLIHNAGIKDAGHSRAQVMAVNADAPIAVATALLDALARAHGRVVLITSQLGARHGRIGSMGDYGDSKAALNDAFREVAQAWADAGVTAIVLHPGWVRTDMGGPNAPVSVEESAAGIRRVIANLTAQDHGHFLTFRGEQLPW